jgi:hypothetical protein
VRQPPGAGHRGYACDARESSARSAHRRGPRLAPRPWTDPGAGALSARSGAVEGTRGVDPPRSVWRGFGPKLHRRAWLSGFAGQRGQVRLPRLPAPTQALQAHLCGSGIGLEAAPLGNNGDGGPGLETVPAPVRKELNVPTLRELESWLNNGEESWESPGRPRSGPPKRAISGPCVRAWADCTIRRASSSTASAGSAAAVVVRGRANDVGSARAANCIHIGAYLYSGLFGHNM